jgi:hypothetical protein
MQVWVGQSHSQVSWLIPIFEGHLYGHSHWQVSGLNTFSQFPTLVQVWGMHSHLQVFGFNTWLAEHSVSGHSQSQVFGFKMKLLLKAHPSLHLQEQLAESNGFQSGQIWGAHSHSQVFGFNTWLAEHDLYGHSHSQVIGLTPWLAGHVLSEAGQ